MNSDFSDFELTPDEYRALRAVHDARGGIVTAAPDLPARLVEFGLLTHNDAGQVHLTEAGQRAITARESGES